jgi:hypothetical protein
MQGIERITNFVSDAGGQESQGLDFFTFDGVNGLLARFGGVVKNESDPGAARGCAIKGGGVKAKKTGAWVLDLEFMPDHALPSVAIHAGNFVPVQLRDEIGDGLALDIRLKPEHPGHGLVEVEDTALLVHDEHAVFDGVEKRFEEATFPDQALNHGLEALGIEAVDTAQDFVQKAGFGRHGYSHFRFLKYK